VLVHVGGVVTGGGVPAGGDGLAGELERDAATTGVDPDPAMLPLARWITALRRPPDVSWLQGRAEKLPPAR